MAVVCNHAVEMMKGRLAKHSCFVAGSRRAIWIRLFITDSPIPLIPIRTTLLLIEYACSAAILSTLRALIFALVHLMCISKLEN
jgi:hypothetical protein